MSNPFDLAKALRHLCVFAFEEDPDTEVGKVQLAVTSYVFCIYVMQGSLDKRTIARTNIVSVGLAGVEVIGPDEQAIGLILKKPLL